MWQNFYEWYAANPGPMRDGIMMAAVVLVLAIASGLAVVAWKMAAAVMGRLAGAEMPPTSGLPEGEIVPPKGGAVKPPLPTMPYADESESPPVTKDEAPLSDLARNTLTKLPPGWEFVSNAPDGQEAVSPGKTSASVRVDRERRQKGLAELKRCMSGWEVKCIHSSEEPDLLPYEVQFVATSNRSWSMDFAWEEGRWCFQSSRDAPADSAVPNEFLAEIDGACGDSPEPVRNNEWLYVGEGRSIEIILPVPHWRAENGHASLRLDDKGLPVMDCSFTVRNVDAEAVRKYMETMGKKFKTEPTEPVGHHRVQAANEHAHPAAVPINNETAPPVRHYLDPEGWTTNNEYTAPTLGKEEAAGRVNKLIDQFKLTPEEKGVFHRLMDNCTTAMCATDGSMRLCMWDRNISSWRVIHTWKLAPTSADLQAFRDSLGRLSKYIGSGEVLDKPCALSTARDGGISIHAWDAGKKQARPIAYQPPESLPSYVSLREDLCVKAVARPDDVWIQFGAAVGLVEKDGSLLCYTWQNNEWTPISRWWALAPKAPPDVEQSCAEQNLASLKKRMYELIARQKAAASEPPCKPATEATEPPFIEKYGTRPSAPANDAYQLRQTPVTPPTEEEWWLARLEELRLANPGHAIHAEDRTDRLVTLRDENGKGKRFSMHILKNNWWQKL